MKLLVFGRTGQLAQELAALAPEAHFLDRTEADLTDPAACAEAILRSSPKAVINAAAWTSVDRAEENEASATVVNGDSPAAMARACKERGVPIVHISTDYVFDGKGDAPFSPEHPTNPIGAYGRSKLRGEIGVAAAGGPHAILRTSWVFSSRGHNFVKTMLRLGVERDVIRVVADQIGGPTPARALAQACLVIAGSLSHNPARSGVYHFSGAPDTSWAAFAREIMKEARLSCEVEDIPTSAYSTLAARPLNSRFDCSNLAVFGLARPDWRRYLIETIEELKERI